MIQVTDSTGAEKQGAVITGASMPSGGSGVLGWLSAIWKALTDRLPSALTGSGNLKVSVVESTATVAVSAASLPLPSGAATAAKQPALGTAGSASADVLTVQGVASMTPLAVSQSGSWTVTAAAGTNLNTSALALESGGNLAAAAASLSVIEDWDESDRAKVNPIAGQAGVAAGNGTVGSTTQRVVRGRNATGELTSVAINASSSGDNSLVGAAASQTTKVYRLFLVATGAVNIKFRDGTTDLTPAITLFAGGGLVLDFDGEPWFTTSTNTALQLNLSSAVQVSGRLYYIRD